jgi:hypothetical protein
MGLSNKGRNNVSREGRLGKKQTGWYSDNEKGGGNGKAER